MTRFRLRHRAFSLVGMLVTLVCIVILFTIGMSAMNKAITGESSAVEGTVHSMQDQMYLMAMYQTMVADAMNHGGRLLTPSDLTGRTDDNDRGEDTTASFFSALVMSGYPPEQLISANEWSGYVVEDDDYDRNAYDPRAGVYWDPSFAADLHDHSNTSFAHMPLYGERFRRHWQSSFESSIPLLGNRGPKDGVDDPNSLTYGRNGRWGGHVVFGDGHVEFIDTFTPGRLRAMPDGRPDNVFAVDDGPGGEDAIIAFTKEMTRNGAVLQFD